MAGEIAVVSESRLKDPEVFAAVHGKRAGFQNPVLPISRIWTSQELAYAPQHHELVVRSALHHPALVVNVDHGSVHCSGESVSDHED